MVRERFVLLYAKGAVSCAINEDVLFAFPTHRAVPSFAWGREGAFMFPSDSVGDVKKAHWLRAI